MNDKELLREFSTWKIPGKRDWDNDAVRDELVAFQAAVRHVLPVLEDIWLITDEMRQAGWREHPGADIPYTAIYYAMSKMKVGS